MSESATGIPFGQPILVGHHNENRHKRTIERAHKAMDKCVEERDKAIDYRRRAEYWESQEEIEEHKKSKKISCAYYLS